MLVRQPFNLVVACIVEILKWSATVVISIVLAVGVEAVGQQLFWETDTKQRLIDRTESERWLLHAAKSSDSIVSVPVELIEDFTELFDRVLIPIQQSLILKTESLQHQANLSPLSSVQRHVQSTLQTELERAISVLRATLVRLSIFLVGCLCIAPLVLAALVDGLVRRDIRRWSGGHESAWIHNLASTSVRPLCLSTVIFIVLWPFPIPLLWLIPAFGVMLVLAIYYSVARLKKYI